MNCDDESNKAFCGSMGVKGFPTLKTIRPTGSKGKPIITDYQGERSAKAIVDAVKGMIPNHVTRVADKELDKWLEGNNASAKAILFSNKGTTSALIKALAVEYFGNLQVAQIRDKEAAAVSTFGITTYPTFLVLPGGTADPIIYDGPMEKKPMSAFLAQYVLSSTDSKGPEPKPAGTKDPKQKPMKEKAASSSDSSTFSAVSTAHASSEAAESAATGTTITLEAGSEATASPDPNIVPSDAPAPVQLPVAPPLPSLTSQSELRAHCLGPKTPTCILALLPPPTGEDLPESATQALASLAEISEKHKVRGSHLFPFFAVPASNEGATALRKGLGVEDGVQLIAVNGRREWYRKFTTDKGYGLVEVEGWVDGIRLGEGKKEKLPAGLVVEETVESATSAVAETASAATESIKSAASKASEYASEKASQAGDAAADATESVKDKTAQATDVAADATEAAAETASQVTETGKATISSMTVVASESAASVSKKARSAASAASEAASEGASSASSKASFAASAASSNVAESAASASEKASSAASVASEKVAETAGSMKSKVAEAVESAAAKVSEKASSVKHEEL